MPGSARYYTDDKSKCSDDVRFIGKNKYRQKILMWLAISNRGMSIPYFGPSKSVAINTEIYINECLQPRLLPFIHKHHGDLPKEELVEVSFSNPFLSLGLSLSERLIGTAK